MWVPTVDPDRRGTFLSRLDAVAAGTGLPVIARDIGMDLATLVWVVMIILMVGFRHLRSLHRQVHRRGGRSAVCPGEAS